MGMGSMLVPVLVLVGVGSLAERMLLPADLRGVLVLFPRWV